MTKRNIFVTTICFLMLLGFTGCGSKTALSAEEFITIAEDNGLETYSEDESFTEMYDLKSATTAYVDDEDDSWFVQFYEFNGNSDAKEYFQELEEVLDDISSSGVIRTSTNLSNYSTYALTDNYTYYFIERVDNTLVISEVDKEYKDQVKDLIKAMDY